MNIDAECALRGAVTGGLGQRAVRECRFPLGQGWRRHPASVTHLLGAYAARVLELRVIMPTDTALRDAVLALAPSPGQEVFSSTARETLPNADADPARTPFAVVRDDVPIGFGVLDRAGYLHELVDEVERAALLRAFYLDSTAQGRGWGTEAARLVPALAATLDGVELVVLTVNERNPRAVAAYARAGFVDTGTRYLGGSAGPQHVMVAEVIRGG